MNFIIKFLSYYSREIVQKRVTKNILFTLNVYQKVTLK